MSVQVLAVRLVGGDDLYSVAELIYRDDDDGKIAYMDRAGLAEWVNNNPAIRVYVRDYLGQNHALISFMHEGSRYLRTLNEVSPRDPLLRLPRYLTPTKAPEMPSPATGTTRSRPMDPWTALFFWWMK